jgi:hypothetical protein
MDATPTYVAEKMAHEYTRDRIRDAEARRAVRVARSAARERRSAGPPAEPAVRVRWWRIFDARATTA